MTENSFDFIDSAIKYAHSKESRDWKYALLNLANGIELMMKAILEKEHWSLLFENINIASKDKLKTGEFKSVDFDTGLNRLKEIVGIPLPIRNERYLRKIRDFRNRITHFSVDINIEEVKSIVARGLNIFVFFYSKIEEEENVKDFVV